jgi:hypothetical protein
MWQRLRPFNWRNHRELAQSPRADAVSVNRRNHRELAQSARADAFTVD